MSSGNLHPVSAQASRPHKVLRSFVYLDFLDSIRLKARALFVSPLGLTMISPFQITKGKICEIEFDIPLDGEMRKVKAVSKTHNCVCVGIDGFRTTMSFIRIDPNSSLALKDLMQYPF